MDSSSETPNKADSESPREYSTRRLLESDLPALVGLFEASFSKPQSVDEARRKFATKAFGAEFVGQLAIAPNGELAAYYGVFPVQMRVGDETFTAAQSGDTMTHPDHRKQGLFIRLAEETYRLAYDEGVKLVFGFPNDNSLPGFQRHLNWTFLPQMHGGEIRANRRMGWSRLWSLKPGGRERAAKRVIERLASIAISDRDEHFDGYLDGIVRDASYLDYKSINSNSMVVRSGDLTVWLVPGTRLSIGAFREERTMSAQTLEAHFQELLYFCGAKSARFCFSQDSEALARLREFCDVRATTQVGFRVLDPSLQVEQLYFCRGDFDYF